MTLMDIFSYGVLGVYICSFFVSTFIVYGSPHRTESNWIPKFIEDILFRCRFSSQSGTNGCSPTRSFKTNAFNLDSICVSIPRYCSSMYSVSLSIAFKERFRSKRLIGRPIISFCTTGRLSFSALTLLFFSQRRHICTPSAFTSVFHARKSSPSFITFLFSSLSFFTLL